MPHKLLLADDSITIQRVIELTFADEDIQVIVVGDGRKAIERVQVERPDIILADVSMPDRDGYDVAAFIKGDPGLSSIPVLLLTGAFEPLDEERARRVGCDGVLVKPFEPQVVISRVKDLLAPRSTSKPVAQPAPPPAAASALRPPGHPLPAPSPGPRIGDDLESTLIPPASPVDRAAADALEDYFDRLDAAFASIGAVQPKPRTEPEPEDLSSIVADLPSLHAFEPPSPSSLPPSPSPTPVPVPAASPVAVGGDSVMAWDPELIADFGPARQPHLANAFAALLAAEQEGGPMTLAPPAPGAITDDVLEEIVARVIARMGDESMRRLVVDTAERLVREEIDRIKAAANPEPGTLNPEP